jgi:glycosyltransferase involved in cell wall biosynthesis
LPPAQAARLRALELEVFARAARIVTITEAARRILIDEYGIDSARVTTVADGTTVATGSDPHPTLPPAGMSAKPIFAPRSGGQGGSFTSSPSIFYVGQLYPWKGAGLVVDVAARVRDARAVIVGGQTNWTADDPDITALAEQARTLGVADRVELRGHVPYERVPAALAEASVALLPLPDEPVARLFTSPLKLFDYMAAGVPIVASDLPSLREVLRNGENALLARAGDADAFAAAVRRLLADRSLADRLGRQARIDVQQYSWDARARALLDVFGDATPDVQRPPADRPVATR